MEALPFDAYLFDLDGTLIDSIELILSSHRHTRATLFGDSLPDAYFLSRLGIPLREIYADMAGENLPLDEIIRVYREFNLAHHDAMVTAYAGVAETIHALRRAGARLGVVTSKAADTTARGLQVAGLDKLFDTVVTADDVARGKPDPEPVLTALHRLQVASGRALFVGDSPHDMTAGRRAGVATAAATWGPFSREVLEPTRPSLWLQRPADVLGL